MGCTICQKSAQVEKREIASQTTPVIITYGEDILKNKEDDNNIDNQNSNIKIPVKEEEEEKNRLPYEFDLLGFLDKDIDDTEVFKKEWYNPVEKEKIIYSKRSIIAMKEKYSSPEMDSEFKEIHNKGDMIITARSEGSLITKDFQLVKTIYKLKKSGYPQGSTLKTVAKYLLFSKERFSWDSGLRLYENIEGNENTISIIHNISKSPVFFVSDREIVEKRYDFMHTNKDGSKEYYCYESSINDDYFPLNKKYERIVDYIYLLTIKEDEEYFYFFNLTQMDPKTALPAAVINKTLPSKIESFFGGGCKGMNTDNENGKLVIIKDDENVYPDTEAVVKDKGSDKKEDAILNESSERVSNA